MTPGTRQRTWATAARQARRAAARHKLAAAIVAVCAAGVLAALALASSDAPGPAPAGDPAAAAFSLPVLGHSGRQVSLAQYAGRPLVVNFFASWCDPCKTETPLLAGFYRDEHAKVAVVGLDENDALGHALSFTRADGVSYPVGWDPQTSAASAYGVAALPQTFFLNARHRIVDRVYGAVTLAELSRGIALAIGR
ncbi:MAG: TlpA family protein disulfide reductase [Streptosporangiaceae bacterium]|nr:TlpA family protein disulfide reductase [Streptosporangiaceae bacterium]